MKCIFRQIFKENVEKQDLYRNKALKMNYEMFLKQKSYFQFNRYYISYSLTVIIKIVE